MTCPKTQRTSCSGERAEPHPRRAGSGTKDHYYLDNASTSWPKPEIVYVTMDRLARSCGVNPGRGNYELAFEADRLVWETRQLLAEFFNHRAGPSHVVFTQNATEALNLALFGVLEDADHVVTTRLEHNSVLRPLFHLHGSRRVSVTYVGRDREGYVDPDEVQKAITRRTKAIVVNHASNVLGAVQDVGEIGRLARESGTLFVLDASQTAGTVDIDIEALGADLLAFAGHKSLFGPMGVGGLLVREGLQVHPFRLGGTGIDSRSLQPPDRYPQRLEAGTLALPAIFGLHAAQRWFAALGQRVAGDASGQLTHREACRIAIRHIGGVQRQQRARLEAAFRSIDGVTVYGPGAGRPAVATLAINLPNMNAEQAGAMLDADFRVCVRSGLHCAPLVHEDERTIERQGAVRFSPSFLSAEEDIEQAIRSVAVLAGSA